MDQRYGLILGQGRSGTNWILDSLDASPMTFCRNEPNECVPSVMDLLPNPWRIGADGARLAQLWDRVAEETLLLMGERDHRLNHPKTFVNPLSQRLGIAQLSARPRLRKQLSRVLWSWGDGEWRMPQWVGHLDDPEIFGVFKLVQGYNWATWVLDNRPGVPVVQVVRHPAGRHESFLRRYIATADAEETRLGKIEQLRELVPETILAERMGPLDDLTLEEAETWFSVYQMEMFEQRASGNPGYLRVSYENMVVDPWQVLEQIFDHFDLPFTSDVQERIERQKNFSVFGAVTKESTELTNGWRERLDPDVAQRIVDIVDSSPISSWWSGDDQGQVAA